MHRSVPRWTLPLAFGTLLASAALTSRVQDQGGLKVHEVAGNVSYIEGERGGNVGVTVGDDGVFVIDTYIPVPEHLEAVERVSKQPVRVVLNTHWHGDHTGNNAAYGERSTIVAHANVRERLLADGKGRPTLPMVTFEDGLTLHLNGEDVSVRHFAAAHTDGDSVAIFPESKVVHMGDLFFNGRFPYIDLDSGGSVPGFVAAVAEMLESIPEDYHIIPGHGPLASIADLRAYHAMLVATTDLVAAALKEGKSAGDMLADGLLAEYEEWSWGFITTERYLAILTRGLSGK